MPAIHSPSKVLITGANGFVAIWVMRTLLARGYSVRGTVRKMQKSEHLKQMFQKEVEDGRVEIVEVGDNTKEDAFDEVVKGVDAVMHTASPFHYEAEDPEEMIQPAVEGTLGILKSALKNNPTLKRIIILASSATVFTKQSDPATFSEEDWNEASIKGVKDEGKDTSGGNKYFASKTLAEKEAWDFVQKHKDEIKWDIVTLHPPNAFGPPIQELTTPESLNTSNKKWYKSVLEANSNTPRDALAASSAWIDVRDLALAHVLAAENDNAGGERIIVSAGPYIWQEWLNILQTLPNLPTSLKDKLTKGYPDLLTNPEYKTQYDTSKEQKLLAIKYHTMEETARDMIKNFEERGWFGEAAA